MFDLRKKEEAPWAKVDGCRRFGGAGSVDSHALWVGYNKGKGREGTLQHYVISTARVLDRVNFCNG